MIFETTDTYHMNLFIFSENEVENAQMYPDTYVNKILLEACQMCCTAHHLSGTERYIIPYRKTHENHPVSRWVRENTANYWWTVNMIECLLSEWYFRFRKNHACGNIFDFLTDNEPNIETSESLKFLGVVIDNGEYRIQPVENNLVAVKSYRQYFIDKKKHVARWTGRKKPSWYPSTTLTSTNKEQIDDIMKYWTKESFLLNQ